VQRVVRVDLDDHAAAAVGEHHVVAGRVRRDDLAEDLDDLGVELAARAGLDDLEPDARRRGRLVGAL
jgi:hypothetical protein